MLFHRKTGRRAALCLALALVAICGTEVQAQTTSSSTIGSSAGAGRTGVANFTGSSGSNSNAPSSASAGGNYTGNSGTGTGAATASTSGGGYTGGGSSSSGFTGSTGMSAAQSTTGTATLAPGVSNILQPTYYNPYNAGLVNNNGQALTNSNAAFGQPSYNTTYSTAATSGTGTAVGTGVVASTMVTGGVGFGYNTYGQGRTYNYVAVPGATLPVVVHSNPKLQLTIADVLQRSASFKAVAPLQVEVNDSTVTIEGTVASAKERRIVEGMIRMTPGVRAVVNNLQIAATPPAPKTGAPSVGP